jgi:hypothetical protein
MYSLAGHPGARMPSWAAKNIIKKFKMFGKVLVLNQIR